MTVLLLLIGLVLVGVAVSLGLRAAAMPRIDADKRLGQIRAYGFGEDEGRAEFEAAAPAGSARLVELLGTLVQGRFAGTEEAKIRSELMAAGAYTLAPTTFLGYRVLSSLAVATLFGWLTIAAGSSPIGMVMLIFVGAAGGWLAPIVLVRRRARTRIER